MNWHDALQAMLSGHHVVRRSKVKRELVGTAPDGLPIYDCGTEAMRLAAAWTVDHEPVMVFQGASSQCLFIPDADDMQADDWIVE